MTFNIGGTDITPYIAYGGIKWTREDVDGPNAGRSITGTMIRDRVATKYRADITCKPLSATASATLLALLAPQWVTVVTDSNPFTGNTSTTYTMYANNISTNVATKLADGTFIWGGLTFPLIQQ